MRRRELINGLFGLVFFGPLLIAKQCSVNVPFDRGYFEMVEEDKYIFVPCTFGKPETAFIEAEPNLGDTKYWIKSGKIAFEYDGKYWIKRSNYRCV